MIFQTLGFAQFFMSFTATSILMSSGVVPSTIQGSHTEGLLRSYSSQWQLRLSYKSMPRALEMIPFQLRPFLTV
jgi:hypothetical protein